MTTSMACPHSADGGPADVAHYHEDDPNGTNVTCEYLSTGILFDDDVSRVSRSTVSTAAIAEYTHTDVHQVVKIG